MSVLTSRPVLRWLVPAAAGLAVVAGGAAIGLITAAADPALPPRSAAQLLVDLQTAKVDGLSGTVVERADLGLPALSVDGSPDLTAMLSGTHTVRLWYAAPDQARIALMGTLGETDVIRNGADQWVWSSKDRTAHHQKSSPGTGASARPNPLGSALPGGLSGATGGGFSPEQFAGLALTALGQSTSVTTSGPLTVAGRNAYELILAPKDTSSRIGSVRVALDADVHIPLRVQVFARGADTAAIEVAFTQVSFARPDPAEFAFNPPPGTTIVESTGTPDSAHESTKDAAPADGTKRTAVVGSGWASVFVVRVNAAGATAPAAGAPAELAKVLATLPTVSGPWGTGKLLSGKLFSVLLTDDGRLLVGAVSPDQLYRAAADPAAHL